LLLVKVCAISGAELPPTDFFSNILSNEFIKFLFDFGYADYNIEEFLLSFRLNANGMKYPSGDMMDKIYFKKCMSINLAADVFGNYRILRNTMDTRLKNLIDGYE